MLLHEIEASLTIRLVRRKSIGMSENCLLTCTSVGEIKQDKKVVDLSL
jgi:hypothetical protein